MNGADGNPTDDTSQWEDQLASWREQILHQQDEAYQAFKHMRGELKQRAHWLALCHALAWDRQDEVREFALRQVAASGEKDDAAAEAAALDVLRAIPEQAYYRTPARDLQTAAFMALGRAGTAAAFPVLYAHAQAGDDVALVHAAKQARTSEQRQQLVALARTFLQSGEFGRSYWGLFVLRRLSRPEREQELLLEVARKDRFDFIIHALGDASPTILPTVRELLAQTSPHTVQHEAALEAITKLEKRALQQQKQAEEG